MLNVKKRNIIEENLKLMEGKDNDFVSLRADLKRDLILTGNCITVYDSNYKIVKRYSSVLQSTFEDERALRMQAISPLAIEGLYVYKGIVLYYIYDAQAENAFPVFYPKLDLRNGDIYEDKLSSTVKNPNAWTTTTDGIHFNKINNYDLFKSFFNDLEELLKRNSYKPNDFYKNFYLIDLDVATGKIKNKYKKYYRDETNTYSFIHPKESINPITSVPVLGEHLLEELISFYKDNIRIYGLSAYPNRENMKRLFYKVEKLISEEELAKIKPAFFKLGVSKDNDSKLKNVVVKISNIVNKNKNNTIAKIKECGGVVFGEKQDSNNTNTTNKTTNTNKAKETNTAKTTKATDAKVSEDNDKIIAKRVNEETTKIKSEFDSKLDAMNEMIKGLVGNVNTLKEQVTNLSTDLDNEKAKRKALEKDNKELKTTNKELEKSNKELAAELKKVNKELDKANKQLEKAKKEPKSKVKKESKVKVEPVQPKVEETSNAISALDKDEVNKVLNKKVSLLSRLKNK